MKAKPIVLREVAARDVDAALVHYMEEGGDCLALDFIEAIEAAFRHIGAHAASGSPRYAIELDLPDLRFWPLKRFPISSFMLNAKTTWTSGVYCTGSETSRLGSSRPSSDHRCLQGRR